MHACARDAHCRDDDALVGERPSQTTIYQSREGQHDHVFDGIDAKMAIRSSGPGCLAL